VGIDHGDGDIAAIGVASPCEQHLVAWKDGGGGCGDARRRPPRDLVEHPTHGHILSIDTSAWLACRRRQPDAGHPVSDRLGPIMPTGPVPSWTIVV
jgi:hypothetical protein